jgi:hypothetical protein
VRGEDARDLRELDSQMTAFVYGRHFAALGPFGLGSRELAMQLRRAEASTGLDYKKASIRSVLEALEASHGMRVRHNPGAH